MMHVNLCAHDWVGGYAARDFPYFWLIDTAVAARWRLEMLPNAVVIMPPPVRRTHLP